MVLITDHLERLKLMDTNPNGTLYIGKDETIYRLVKTPATSYSPERVSYSEYNVYDDMPRSLKELPADAVKIWSPAE